MKNSISFNERYSNQLSFIDRTASSPILSTLLLGATCFAATSWYQADAVQNAPVINGFDWQQHPNALLIVYPTKSCGCGAAPLVRVQEGLQHGLDVVVMAPLVSDELKSLQSETLPSQRFLLSADADIAIVHRFSPSDDVTTVRVKNGRIVDATSNSILTEAFFAEESL